MALLDIPKMRTSLEKLEEMLRCGKCKQTSNQLSFIGLCDHIFCAKCIRSISNQCPTCQSEVSLNNFRPVRQLAEIADICANMRVHLDEYQHTLEKPAAKSPKATTTEPDGDSTKPSTEPKKKFAGTLSRILPKRRGDGTTVKASKESVKKASNTYGLKETVKKNSKASTSKQGSRNKSVEEDVIVLQEPEKKQGRTKKRKTAVSVSDEGPPKAKMRVEENTDMIAGSTETHNRTDDGRSIEATPRVSSTAEEKLQESPSSTGSQAGSEYSVISEPLNFHHPVVTSLKKSRKGATDLHWACQRGDYDAVQELLSDENAIEINVADNAGWTPLHEASFNGQAAIVEILLKAGAIVDPVGGFDFMTPLHMAIQRGNADVVKTLVSYGADVNAKTALGDTAVMLARRCGRNKSEIELILVKMENWKRPSLPVIPAKKEKGRIGISFSYLEKDQIRRLVIMANMTPFKDLFRYLPVYHNVDTTHLVVGESPTKRSFKYLRAVLAGKWVVTFGWILKSLEQGRFVDEEPFEATGSINYPNSGGPRRARKNFQSLKPGLFAGCQVYLHDEFPKPEMSADSVKELIKLGQGKVETRIPKVDLKADRVRKPYHADETWKSGCLVLYQDRVDKQRLEHPKTNVPRVPLTWLIDCIDHFRLLPFPNASSA